MYKLSRAANAFRVLCIFCFLSSLIFLVACGRLWGGVSFFRAGSSSGILGLFVGAIGNTTASTGTCPAAGVASGWCTGGTFGAGTSDGTFSSPKDIAVDSLSGYFYVTDTVNHNVQKFSIYTGAFVGAIGNTTASTGTCPAAGAAPGWCTGGAFGVGAGDGMFDNPAGVDVDTVNGFLYVADGNNHRLQKFNLITGAFIGAWGRVVATTGTCPAAGATNSWCTGGTFAQGNTDGAIRDPEGIAVDVTNDFLYVADRTNRRIQKLVLSTGVTVGSIGNKGAGTTGTCPAGAGPVNTWCTGGTFSNSTIDGGFSLGPNYLAIDATTGFLYATENSGRIHKITASTGAFVGAVGNTIASTGTCPASGPAPGWCTGGTFGGGGGDGSYNFGEKIVLDYTRQILYHAAFTNHVISKVSLSTGGFIGRIGYTSASTGTCPSSGAAQTWCIGGAFTNPNADGSYPNVWGLGLDSINQILLAADSARKVSKIQ